MWHELYSIYDIDIQVACDVNRISLEDGVVKYSKSVEYHESEDDSPISAGQLFDRNLNNSQEMKSIINLLIFW